jgi:hypothetical protein
MSWFTRLFNITGNVNNPNGDQTDEDNVNVLEDLFVNKTAPVEVGPPASTDEGGLKAYLEQDFFHKGYEDGYNGHSFELLENKILSMKADFRYNLGLKIDLARQDILKLENHRANMEGMSDRLVKQLDNQIAAIRFNITELEAEIALSALNEGHVMIAVHQYRYGFLRGTEAYQEEKIIAGSTGLFN